MSDMDEKQQKAYLADPGVCYICGSVNCFTESSCAIGAKITKNLYCEICDTKWLETYTLTAVRGVK